MPKRKPARRPKPTPSPEITADKFLGLSGIFKQWANLGLAGILAGLAVYLVSVSLPNAQERFHDELRIEREIAVTERQKSREHGNSSARELAESIKEQTRVLSDHLSKNRETQLKILEAQLKAGAK